MEFNSELSSALNTRIGAGQGVGVAIPNLLDYGGSIVCTDIKGENRAITARRRAKLGKVVALDITDAGFSNRFNPLHMVRAGTFHEKDDAEALAKLMIVSDGRDSHWDSKTEGLISPAK